MGPRGPPGAVGAPVSTNILQSSYIKYKVKHYSHVVGMMTNYLCNMCGDLSLIS